MKQRKWSNLKGQIPDEPVELTERQKKVFEQADALRRSHTMQEIAQEWSALDEEDEFSDRLTSERNIRRDALKHIALERLKEVEAVSGQDMWRGEGQTFSPKHELVPHVLDKAALKGWIEQTGQTALLELPIKRLLSIVSEAMNPENAVGLTPAERAALPAGAPGSMKPPPGVTLTIWTKVHHTDQKTALRKVEPDDVPF